MSKCKKRYRKRLVLLTLVIVVLFLAKPTAKRLYPDEYSGYVIAYGDEYGVPSSLVFAVIHCESRFRYDAVSKAGACGLMQLTEATFQELSIRLQLPDDSDIFEPRINILCGTYYLRYLFERYGNWETALAAYNAGLGNVDEWLNDPAYSVDGTTLIEIPFRETKTHVKKVLTAWEIYKKLYKE